MNRNWTDEQRELFETGSDGVPRLARVAVAADAGAGKTSVLVERVRNLKVPEGKRVLCVSFTEKSKADLEQKLSEWLYTEVYTIHGFCGRVVNEFGATLGLSPLFRILDQDETDDLFYRSFEKVYRRLPPDNTEHGIDRFFELCKKAHAIGPDVQIADSTLAAFVKSVVDDFENSKTQMRVLEYADLEWLAVKLLKQPEVAQALQTRYSHVFVDEFQDTSRIQCSLVNAISGAKNPVFVVGDVKQSIYRFRGADVRVFEEFIKTLPAQKRLSANFRSHAEIIDAVNSVCAPIIENYQPMTASRIEKDQAPVWNHVPRVARITSEIDADGIEAVLLRLKEQGVSWSQVVLLLRRIRGNEELFAELSRRGIGVAVTSSASASSNEDLSRLLNLWVWACEPWQKLRAAQVVVDFTLGEEPSALRVRLQEFADALASPLTGQVLSCGSLLQALAQKFKLRERFGATFEQFEVFVLRHQSDGLLPGALARRLDRLLSSGQDIGGFVLLPPPANLSGAIRVLTVHGSKGLEFPVVILADVKKRRNRGTAIVKNGEKLWLLARDEKGALDKSDPETQAALESEALAEEAESARLLYVAMTRAQEALYVIDRPPEPITDEDEKKKKAPKKEEVSWAQWLKNGLVSPVSKTMASETFFKVNPAASPLERDLAGSKQKITERKPVCAEPFHGYTRARLGVTELAGRIAASLPVGPTERVRAKPLVTSGVDGRELGIEIHSYLETANWNALEETAKRAGLNLKPFHEWRVSETGLKVFGAGGRHFPEFAFEWKSEQGIVAGRIDKLIAFDDETWIVDYKVLKSRRDAADLLSTYSSQLQIYADAVKELTKSNRVRTFLLDVSAATGSVWHEVNPKG